MSPPMIALFVRRARLPHLELRRVSVRRPTLHPRVQETCARPSRLDTNWGESVVFRVKSAKSNQHVTLLLGEFDSLGEAKAYVYGATADRPTAHPFGLAIFAVTSTGTEALVWRYDESDSRQQAERALLDEVPRESDAQDPV